MYHIVPMSTKFPLSRFSHRLSSARRFWLAHLRSSVVWSSRIFHSCFSSMASTCWGSAKASGLWLGKAVTMRYGDVWWYYVILAWEVANHPNFRWMPVGFRTSFPTSPSPSSRLWTSQGHPRHSRQTLRLVEVLVAYPSTLGLCQPTSDQPRPLGFK